MNFDTKHENLKSIISFNYIIEIIDWEENAQVTCLSKNEKNVFIFINRITWTFNIVERINCKTINWNWNCDGSEDHCETQLDKFIIFYVK